MLFNSKNLAFIISGTTAAIIAILFYGLGIISFVNACYIFGSCLIACFSISYFILHFYFFSEINKINTVIDQIKKKEFSLFKNHTQIRLNPFRKINEEIFMFAYLKQKEIDELKKLENFRRDFFADVSHELKTPIFAAQGFLHTLLDGAIHDKKVRIKFLKKAAKSLDGLDILVQDMLMLSQMEAGEITMHPEKFDIHHATHEIFDQFEEKASKKNIELILSAKNSEAVYVVADQRRINQVMVNLISNAIKYGKENGSVKVSFFESKERKNYIQITVKDDGIGIPSKDLQRIFDRFYRVEKSRSKDKGGTGLGLSITKHILEAHGSEIQVTSNKDKGSIFSFELEKALE